MSINPNDYTTHKRPGKFEGEGPEAEYFYEQMLNGDGERIYAYSGDDDQTEQDFQDTEGASAELFQVSADESEAFDLPIGHWVLLREDSAGFVFCTTHETREAAEQKFRQWLGLE